jgi:hypothetical protein
MHIFYVENPDKICEGNIRSAACISFVWHNAPFPVYPSKNNEIVRDDEMIKGKRGLRTRKTIPGNPGSQTRASTLKVALPTLKDPPLKQNLWNFYLNER